LTEYDVEEFKKRYPHLAKELAEGKGVRRFSDVVEGEAPPFIPGPVDYLRRCKSVEEAKEVLDYLERIGELDKKERADLEEQLDNEGLESFGSRKDFGYYSERYLKNLNLKALQRRLP